MKKNIDELLNDYIDSQLTSEELEDVKNLLNSDQLAASKLRAMRVVHQSLKQIEPDLAPTGFTERLMGALNLSPGLSKQKKNYFFYGVVGFFSLLIIGSLLTVVLSVNWNVGSLNLTAYIDEAKSGISKSGSEAFSVFKNKTVLMISSSLVLIMLILAYFGFESHKSWKKKINSFSH